MRKPILYPALALGLGAAAALLRMWQRGAYDSSGLPVPFAVPSLLLAAFLGMCAGGFLYLALKQPKAPEGLGPFPSRGGAPAALFTAAGVLMLAGGAVELLRFAQNYLDYSQVLYASAEEQQKALRLFLARDLMTAAVAVAAVPAAAALVLRAKPGTPKPFAAAMPSIFCGVWLMDVYRGHTANPVLWDYALFLLAVAALLLSSYEQAGFAFGVGKPRRAALASLAALTLTVAALPDCGGIANAAFLAALGLQAGVELSALLSALEHAPAEPETPNSIQQEDVPHEQ